MRCTQCGTEIADKALICFRCGKATTDPVFKPPAASRRRGSPAGLVWEIVGLAMVAVLVLFALVLGRQPAAQTPRLIVWIAAGIAAVVVARRGYARRR